MIFAHLVSSMKSILLCSALYGIIYSIPDVLHVSRIVTCICIPLYLLVLLGVMCRTNKLKEYRLCCVQNLPQAILLTAPLFFLPVYNFMLRADNLVYVVPELSCVVLISSSAFAEELLFRGALPPAFVKHYELDMRISEILSSAVFAFLHFSHFFRGIGFWRCSLHAVLAFGVASSLAALTDKTGSIIPATIIHILINLTGADTKFSLESVGIKGVVILLSISALSYFYGLWIYQHKDMEGENSNAVVH